MVIFIAIAVGTGDLEMQFVSCDRNDHVIVVNVLKLLLQVLMLLLLLWLMLLMVIVGNKIVTGEDCVMRDVNICILCQILVR
jgi:hypothetical protein